VITPLHARGDRVIVVTGGAGFLGSRLVRDLAADPRFEGATLRIVDNLYRGTYPALMDLPPGARYELAVADLLDGSSMRRALRGADAVVHLAALVQTPFSFEHPTWTEHVNHWGTARLLELAIEERVAKVVFASSASVYGPGGPFAEGDPCRPVGPYSQSKFRAEQAVAVAAERGLTATVIRLGTLFGWAPGARFDAIPNRLAYQAAIGQPIAIHGSGGQRRSVVHVADASRAVILALLDGALPPGTYNAALENPTITEVAAAVADVWTQAEVRYTEQHALAHFSLAIDSSRLRAAGWAPSVSLREGLAELHRRFGPFHAPAAPAAPWAEA
jgi:UDP-glucose 4-epimerase